MLYRKVQNTGNAQQQKGQTKLDENYKMSDKFCHNLWTETKCNLYHNDERRKV